MKIKNMKRTVVTTALALTLTAGLTIPTQAAPRRLNTEEFKPCLQVSTSCKDRRRWTLPGQERSRLCCYRQF